MGCRVSHLYFFILLILLIFPYRLYSANIYDFLTMPEENIDIGIAALTLAKDIYPDIEVKSYSAKIDDLAEKVRKLAKKNNSPDYRIRCLNTVLHLHEKFHCMNDVINREQDYYYLNRFFDTKIGNCYTMPLLYVAIGQRLGWPLYIVHVPDHMFVRYIDPHFPIQNIETTSGGAHVPDEKYAKDFSVSKTGHKNGTYLRTSTHRELLGDLVSTNGIRFAQKGQTFKAITYFKVAIKLNPRCVEAWANLRSCYNRVAKNQKGREVKRYRKMAANCTKRLDKLGFVHPYDVPLPSGEYIKRIKNSKLAVSKTKQKKAAISYSEPNIPIRRNLTILPNGQRLNPNIATTIQSFPSNKDQSGGW